jgi:hypothetical protein
MLLRALLLTAGLVSPVLAQAQPGIAAGGKDGAIKRSRSPSKRLPPESSTNMRWRHWSSPSICGKRAGRMTPFSFSI